MASSTMATNHSCAESRSGFARRASREGSVAALLKSLDIKSSCGASERHRPILHEHNTGSCYALSVDVPSCPVRPLSAPPIVVPSPHAASIARPSPKTKAAVELVSPSCTSALRAAVEAASEALMNGKSTPELCAEGLSGSYFLRNVNGKIEGVFKPEDEEGAKPGSQVEHSVFFASTWRKGIPKGKGCLRERAAYVLDHDGLAGVPGTALVHMRAKLDDEDTSPRSVKHGSFQMFADSTSSCEDMGPSAFPVAQVQRIGLLDLRIMNVDRHAGNILWNSKTKQLVPIDHGLCLPEYPHLDDIWFCWMCWPQSKEPFGPEEKAYVAALDVEKDVELARKELGFPAETLLTLRIGTMLTKKGVAAGLTLYELGQIVCSTNEDSGSELQRMCGVAEESGEPGSVPFLARLESELDSAFAAIIAARK